MRASLLLALAALSGCTLIGGYFDYQAADDADLGAASDLGPIRPGVTVEVTPSSIPNDGVRYGEVVVTLRDDNLEPIADQRVTLTSSRSADTITRVSPLAATGRHGTVLFRVTSTVTGASTLTATAVVAGQPKMGTAEVHFLPSLSLVAGQPGGPGWADGIGEAARLQPSGLAWDGEALLVADSYYGLVRRIDVTTHAVTTLVGDPVFGPLGRLNVDGPVGLARFAAVSDLAVVGNDVYIADHVSCTIRKLDRLLMQVSIVAGSGCAQAASSALDGPGAMATFHAPRGIVEVSSSTLYVADGDQVRKLSLSGGTASVSTLGPVAPSTTPQLVTIVALGTDAYVTDVAANMIVKIASDGTTSDVIAVPQAPVGLTTDGTRLFYSFGSEIHAVLPDGSSPTTITNQLPGASALHYDPINKRLYAAIRNEAVVAVDPSTGTVTRLAGLARPETRYAEGQGPLARLNGPIGIAADPSGMLYVADRGNCRIRKIDPVTLTVTTLAGNATCAVLDGTGANARFLAPFGIAYTATPSPALWVSESAPACVIRRIDLATLAVTTALGKASTCATDIGTGAGASFSSPARVASDGANLLYIADSTTLWRVNVGLPLARTPVAMMMPGTMTGLAVSAAHVYIASAGNQVLWRMNRDGTGLATFAGFTQQPGATDGPALGTASFGNPYALALGPTDQTLLVSEYRNNLLRQIDLVNAAHPVTTVAGTLRRGAVAFDPVPSFNFVVDMVRVGGDYFLVDVNENVVLRYRP